MLIKTVTTVVTTDSTGKPVDAIPVRNATAGETDAAGRPVTPISVTEDPLGIPVRVVTGKSAQNSAGQWIDSIPIQGGGGPVTPVLGNITVSPNTATVGTPYSGTSSGRTAGSTLSLSGAGAAGLSIDNTTGAITGTPTTAGAVNVIETLAGATGSPKTNAGAMTVAAAAVMAAGSTFGIVGDGLTAVSGGVGPGINNTGHQFEALIGMGLQPVAAPILGKSGSTIATVSGSNQPFIYPYALDVMGAQMPNLFIINTMGHNEKVIGTNPTGSAPLADWRTAVSYGYAKFTAYAAATDLFIVVGTAASNADPGETTYRSAVWAQQAAHVASLGGGDPRVIFIDVSGMLPPENYSSDTTSSYTHLDERGAYYIASAIKTAIASKIVAKTPDEVRDMIEAGTYPLMSGAQLDTDRDLTGTGGTLTGVTSSGGLAASKLVQNTTGAALNVEMQTVTGSRRKIVVALSGSASAAGKVMVGDKANLAVTAKPGQFVRTGARVKASAGFHNFGADYNGALYGTFGGTANSLVNNGLVSAAGESHALDTLMFTNDLPLWGATYAGKRNVGLFWRSGTALSGTFEVWDFFAYLVSERSRVPARYIGDFADAAGTLFFAANQRLRLTGTISQAAGGTLRVEPGFWLPRGLLETDDTARRIYRGSITDTAINSGTLMATISGSTWTATFGAGVVTTGDRFFVERDVVDPITGNTITKRSLAVDALTAT